MLIVYMQPLKLVAYLLQLKQPSQVIMGPVSGISVLLSDHT